MITVEIYLAGQTLAEIEQALEEARKGIAQGNPNGNGEQVTGSFHFTLEQDASTVEHDRAA